MAAEATWSRRHRLGSQEPMGSWGLGLVYLGSQVQSELGEVWPRGAHRAEEKPFNGLTHGRSCRAEELGS